MTVLYPLLHSRDLEAPPTGFGDDLGPEGAAVLKEIGVLWQHQTVQGRLKKRRMVVDETRWQPSPLIGWSARRHAALEAVRRIVLTVDGKPEEKLKKSFIELCRCT